MKYTLKAENVYTDTVWYPRVVDENTDIFTWTTDQDSALLFESVSGAVTALAQRTVTNSKQHQHNFIFTIVGMEPVALPKFKHREVSL